nr:hypothetical protein BaRGS_022896 [Batillaria attramentaria]
MMAAPAFQDKVFANLCQGIDHLYTDQQLCDLKVVVGEQTFECHRLVLAAVSQFFQALLTSSWRESSSGIVNIEHEDVPAESFSLLLDILYHGKDIITMETAKDILKMSIFLQVKFLEDYCEQYLSDNMAPDTCLGVWLFADRYQLTTLAKKASHMAVTQCTDVPKSKEVVQLSKGTLLIFLSSQKQLSMDGVCETILRWVEGDIESRKDHLGELLPFVSFPHLTQEYLSTLMAYMHHPLKDTVFGYSFKAVPEACGFNFATCKWRNELYVCGGSQNPTFFAKYKPGDDEWEVLPALPQGREGHVMVAVSGNIYVIGGLEEGVVVKKSPASDVMVYNTKIKDWGRKGLLFMAVQDASAAALGHRIYVFGGWEAGGNPMDIVQCVDTVTGCVYEAGHLPSPTTGARAVSDGGTITIATTDCHVLKMKEDFILADRRERQLAAEKTNKSGNKGGGDDAIPPTVTFIQVGEFPKRTKFGVFLDGEELVVCGGQAEDGQLLDDITGIHLESGVTEPPYSLETE